MKIYVGIVDDYILETAKIADDNCYAGADGVLIIAGHGGSGQIGGYDGTTLFNTIEGINWGTIQKVYLLSCDSGAGGVNSLAYKFTKALSSADFPGIVVKGNLGDVSANDTDNWLLIGDKRAEIDLFPANTTDFTT
jgi:hypothetical protein